MPFCSWPKEADLSSKTFRYYAVISSTEIMTQSSDDPRWIFADLGNMVGILHAPREEVLIIFQGADDRIGSAQTF